MNGDFVPCHDDITPFSGPPEESGGSVARRCVGTWRTSLELCAMLGPALRDKHAACEPTCVDGMSKFSTTAVESEIRPSAH